MKVSVLIDKLTQEVAKDMHVLNMDVEINGGRICIKEPMDSSTYDHWEEVEVHEGNEQRTEAPEAVSVEIQEPQG